MMVVCRGEFADKTWIVCSVESAGDGASEDMLAPPVTASHVDPATLPLETVCVCVCVCVCSARA